jgi:hypothetical protein
MSTNHVFVLDIKRKPLTPCKAGMARSLLNSGKAAVFRRFPFTIILKKEVIANPEPIEIKIDAGSKTTGLALVQGEKVIFGAELSHRGQFIKNRLELRRSLRDCLKSFGDIQSQTIIIFFYAFAFFAVSS